MSKLDKSLHDVLREFAERLEQEHGIRLNRVQFTWVDVSSTSKCAALVGDVTVETVERANK